MTSRVSRLDRQVILIETGSTQVVRNMAADQMGDLAKQHPEDILSLLSRVYPFLLVKKWETRVTAARAVGGIVAHAPSWDPNESDLVGGTNEGSPLDNAQVKLEHEMKIKLEEATQNNQLNLLQEDHHLSSLSDWKLNEILKSGKVAPGVEYE